MTQRPRLVALAERLGVAAFYWDIAGNARVTSDATREALVAAMGFDASGEQEAARALAALDAEAARALVEPVLVWREYGDARPAVSVRAAQAAALDYEIELRLEDGARHVAAGRVEPGTTPSVEVPLPVRPPPGHHDLALRLSGAGVAPCEGRQRFIMAPRTAFQASERLGERKAFGLWANLYTLRRRQSGFGVGDFGDLPALLRWCGEAGGAFVGLSPLHAVPNRGTAITPYSPSSRLYRNVLYLDVEAVPELASCAAARARLADPGFASQLARLQRADMVDHEAVLDAKLAVLRDLFACFRADRGACDTPRAAAFAAFREREGAVLRDFATWEVLAAALAERPGMLFTDWRRWPAKYRDPRSPAVETFRTGHAEEVEFRAWLQFELAEQLATAEAAGREAGLEIGLYQDLAVGSAVDSADTWLAQRLFATDASVGAPPDDYAPEGQDWGFPPFVPHRLRADGYRFVSALLRANFAHAGALRIDHAMGLLRLFWIPAGRPGREGTYVRYPHEELFGVLALESRRQRALVIAEDLGTVPEEFPPLLVDWGILSSAVLYFERDGIEPRPAHRIASRALATVETHDLAPLAGFAAGRDLRIRRAVGQIPDEAALAEALAARRAEFDAWLARLREEGLLPAEGEPDPVALAAAVHAFLARTPAQLVGVALDDLAGEPEPVNVPGIPVEQHRSWSRRLRRTLDEIAGSPTARAVLAAVASRARPRTGSAGGSRSERAG